MRLCQRQELNFNYYHAFPVYEMELSGIQIVDEEYPSLTIPADMPKKWQNIAIVLDPNKWIDLGDHHQWFLKYLGKGWVETF